MNDYVVYGMSEMELLHNSMRDGFNKIFNKLDVLQEKQISNQKDIEYIKKEINGKLDEKMDTKIETRLLKKENKILIIGITAVISLVIGLIKFFVG